MKQNYLIVTREFPPQDGGIAQVAYELADHFGKSGNSVSVLAWANLAAKGPSWFQDKSQSFCIYRIAQPILRIFQILCLTFQILKICRDQRVTKIIATTWNFSGVAAALAKYFCRIPFVVIAHGYEISKEGLCTTDQKLMDWTLKKCAKVYAVSQFTGDKVKKNAQIQNNLEIIPNGVDAAKFYPEAFSQAWVYRNSLVNKKILLTLARLFARKGHDQVIKAMPMILKAVPDAVYVIGGVGEEKERLIKLAEIHNVSDKVKWLGFVPQNELSACYASAHVFVLPNREIHDPSDRWVGDFEGFGISFLEASACGVPVVGGKSGGAVDAIKDGETGFLVNPENVGEIAERCIFLLTHDEERKQMGSAGRRWVEKEMNWKSIAKKYEDSLEHL